MSRRDGQEVAEQTNEEGKRSVEQERWSGGAEETNEEGKRSVEEALKDTLCVRTED